MRAVTVTATNPSLASAINSSTVILLLPLMAKTYNSYTVLLLENRFVSQIGININRFSQFTQIYIFYSMSLDYNLTHFSLIYQMIENFLRNQ